MKTKHTPEPWAIYNKHGFETNISGGNIRIAEVKHYSKEDDLFTTDSMNENGDLTEYIDPRINEGKSNAARIVECVNACAGMEDPAFEIAFLREQLRECTDALRGMVEGTTLEFSAANGFYDQRNKAKKVLEDLTPRP